jgi:hypothetical protein
MRSFYAGTARAASFRCSAVLSQYPEVGICKPGGLGSIVALMEIEVRAIFTRSVGENVRANGSSGGCHVTSAGYGCAVISEGNQIKLRSKK